MKLLSVTVPCYNSQDYMRHCVETLLPGGDEVGWMVSDGLYWVDFDHQKTVVDDGLNGEVECYIIDAPFPPVSEREYEDMEL